MLARVDNTCSWLYVFVQHDVLIDGIAVEMRVAFYARRSINLLQFKKTRCTNTERLTASAVVFVHLCHCRG